jgi:hypothetical protein
VTALAALAPLAPLAALAATVAALAAAIATLRRSLSALPAAVAALALALATAKTAPLPGTRPALTLATVSSALTRWLGLPRESTLTESAAKTLLAALLANGAGDTGQMSIRRGRLPVVVVRIDFRRPRRLNQHKVRRRLRFEFVVLVILVIKQPVGVSCSQCRISRHSSAPSRYS